jgi:integrase
VRHLVADAQDKERWVIPSAAENQYGDRGTALGQRFGRLKTAMGFGPELVFHSIRKTVATLLEDAGCPEGVAADILGHDKPTMTYGLYSGGSSMATKREWLEKAVRYDLTAD